jgi:hypothetical protein
VGQQHDAVVGDLAQAEHAGRISDRGGAVNIGLTES